MRNTDSLINIFRPVKPEEMFPVMEDGKYVDKWAIRTTAMIARELGKQNNKAA
ncbi:TPA: restriction endonuclease [Escherichia coli]|nr:restriction endonuclease [Escherichia coli]